MDKPKFVYVIYIRTTPEKLWNALREPEFTRKFWVESVQDCEWKVGASWKMMIPDGRVADSGEILEYEPHKKLVLTWENQFQKALKAEGTQSRLTYELEPQGDMVKLTLTHEFDRPGSKLEEGVSGGWPMILCSLKSLLETGEALEATSKWPEGY